MMTIMGKRFTNRGISTIIAALLLIAIAIAAGVLLYVFSIGLIGSLQGSGGQQVKDQLIMEAYKWSGTSLVLNLRNTGSTTINLATATFYVNATQATGTPLPTLVPSGFAAVTVTTSGTGFGTFTSGAAYVVKIGLSDGGIFSYSAIYGTAS